MLRVSAAHNYPILAIESLASTVLQSALSKVKVMDPMGKFMRARI